MFWIDIPGGLAVLIVVVFLIYTLIKMIVNKIKDAAATRECKRKFKVIPLYDQIKGLNHTERQEFLDSLSPRERKRYEYALSVWHY
jgi:hypothetical protein